MSQILLDNNGYVKEYALIGFILNGQDFNNFPEDINDFEENYRSYKLIDGVLHKDEDRASEINLENQKETFRFRREKECFSYINRGPLWYDKLSGDQKVELQLWYDDWLDVTDTLIIPIKPEWLESK
jgi:hypothetical protein